MNVVLTSTSAMVEMAYDPRLVVSRAPHIKITVESTRCIMRDMMVALLPATTMGIYLFGSQIIPVVAASIGAAVLTEAVTQRRFGSPAEMFGDGSAAVTGLLLALSLPPAVGAGYAMAGGVFSILFGKVLQGGLGRNLFNPALVGRAIMAAVWPATMAAYTFSADGITVATALVGGRFSPQQLFVGTVPGSIGETSVILLLAGAAYLYVRRRIELRIPLSFIATAAVSALIIGADPIVHVFSGGLMMGALFMATDWVTSPMSDSGKVLFGMGCGFVTVIIREFSRLPGGVMYAILLMNALVPLLDHVLKRKALGEA